MKLITSLPTSIFANWPKTTTWAKLFELPQAKKYCMGCTQSVQYPTAPDWPLEKAAEDNEGIKQVFAGDNLTKEERRGRMVVGKVKKAIMELGKQVVGNVKDAAAA